MSEFTLLLQGSPLPARWTELDGARAVEIEGVAIPYVSDEVPHGLSPQTEEQLRKVSELKRRCRVTSEASVVAFEVQEDKVQGE